MEAVRIQKYLSDMGVTSRRAAERDIQQGLVKVNGIVCEIGQKINPSEDTVTYRGRRVAGAKGEGVRKVYLMLNKPRGYLTTMSDEYERRCVTELIADVGCRVYPVGRLDKDSQGLLLFTNDGDFANYMTHPSHEIPKIYHVKLAGAISPEQLEKLRSPMVIDGYELKPVEAEIISRTEDVTTLEFVLHEGRNRQIRKMCESVGLRIRRLSRVAIGELKLGDLRPGKYRFLTKAQVQYLMPSKELK